MGNKKKKKQVVLESHWDVCSQYPPEDWRHEVADDNTRLGYREWVEHQIEMNDDPNLAVAAPDPVWPQGVPERVMGSVAMLAIGPLHDEYKKLNKARRDPEEYGIQPRETLEVTMRALALLNNFILESAGEQDNYLEEDIAKVDMPCAGQACDGDCDNVSCDADK